MATGGASNGGQRAAMTLLEDIIVWEILTRLPVKPLLRCRAVCRSWRRLLTSDPKFLLAHHRRQPSLQLVSTGDAVESGLDALDHRAGERRPVARTDRAVTAEDLEVVAACDGLLIFCAYNGLHICNPSTRQRAPLPLLNGTRVSALFPHCPSGSYRVLCWVQRPTEAEDSRAVYYVHTVGSAEVRCVGEPPEPWPTGDIAQMMPMLEFFHPHVLVQGKVHWKPVKLPGRKHDNMLVFDTVAECFQHISTPVEADLWVLLDYENQVWSFKYRIELQMPIIFLVPDTEGDVLVTSGGRGVQSLCLQYVSASNSSVLTRYQWNIRLKLKRLRFKESLVRHAFFPTEEGGE
ncbi:hypothetical protein BRADI_3g09840v3 [Brachypodium distachyon]|uniref:Uncharacterized protein n=1 Tax=Brachypodium distachyon TaxID=15368 RepID=A0A0Q3F419_BRADI|nr:hypothetical protein BRADI_3g09840v3 [Brachypodium distachyon]